VSTKPAVLPRDPDSSYLFLCRRLRELGAMDLAAYKSPQVQRRLVSFLEKRRLPNLAALARALDDPGCLEDLKVFLTINVTEFFRNYERFVELDEHVLPQLPAGNLRVWSAGCSNGAEAYSLAMLLHKGRPAVEHHIWGTDINGPGLAKAETGLYTLPELKGLPREYLQTCFLAEGQFHRVHPEIRRMVRFAHHDLLRHTFPAGYHLIACRNVMIYFTEEARAKIYRGFRKALEPEGFLFVGGTETLLNSPDFGLVQYRPFFYRAV